MCTVRTHESWKLSDVLMEAHTTFHAVADYDGLILEMRNCKRCHSTICREVVAK